ncbi:DNA gyrase subunit A [Constrictibacter sp. MBR-5]|uniref:DNA gyrase subunit A n=1 Tax=Constrictibacter sp. MBR-5 TaxID=3156467 RepID=UPI00339A19C5
MSETPPTPIDPQDIKPVTIEEEMQRSYLDYAMSVIVSRALPDVRDGLKPVHRRILYAMLEGGYDWAKPFRKSARVVGDVMGKYHPHGDSAIYDAMVRMAQDFSMRLPLVTGQGNFGSMDGDRPAAMRYTEARLARSAEALLAGIDENTVDFQPNYDESESEPTVLPAQFPNLLVNGAGGIAVGMATNIPPHNLGEVVDATLAYIDNPGITVEELLEIVPGPDFPTGGIIVGRGGIRQAYATGRGSIMMRAKTAIETMARDREAIIVTEVPYQVNKARMVERIAEVVALKLIDGISELRDESDRHGIRVVIELKRDAQSDVVLNQLYRFTPLQTSFGVNALALNGGRPEMLPLRDMLAAFVAFREEVITRRTVFRLGKARARAHTLIGLAVAVANLDEVIATIRRAGDPAEARAALTGRSWPALDLAPLIALVGEPGGAFDGNDYTMSEEQARAILDLRLHRLTGLEREKIAQDLKETVDTIEGLLEILRSRETLYKVLREELVAVRDRFADPRRTVIEDGDFNQDIEDLIASEDMVVTVSQTGYVKRVPLSTYRAQRRGGKGRAGMATREEDFVRQVFVANTHTPILFFSSNGIAYKLKVYRLPIGTPTARGKAMVNLLPLSPGETITTIMPMPEDEERWGDWHVMFATANGNVRRNKLSDFVSINVNGKIAMKLDEGDSLVGVATCSEADHVLLATAKARCIRFPVDEVRVFMGRTSSGIRGIALEEGDRVISMTILQSAEFAPEERDAFIRMAAARRRAADAPEGTAEGAVEAPGEEPGEESGAPLLLTEERYAEMAASEDIILTIAANGLGKRTSAYDYRVTRRGGKGIVLMDLGSEDNSVAAAFPVGERDELVLVTNGGQLIRVGVGDIRIARRSTRGVRIFHVAEGEKVVSVTRLAEDAEAAAEDAAAAAAAGEAAAPTQLPMDGGAGEDEAPESGET